MQPSNPFKTIRSAGVPICAFETADPKATTIGILEVVEGKNKDYPVMLWDLVRGLVGVNDAGMIAAQTLAPNGPIESGNPTECLALLVKCPKGSVVLFSNAHRFITNEGVAQAVWNLRDIFERNKCTLVLMAPSLILPAELKHDIVVVSEALPDTDQLGAIVNDIMEDAGLTKDKLPDERRPKVTDTLRGLSAFAAKQVLAMSISREGINEDTLWERKRRMIEQTPGLQVWKGGETFDQLGGLGNLKQFLTKLVTSGKTPVRAIGFIDEIEKTMAGTGGDTSGTSQDQLSVFLKVMQDDNIPGIILIGHPGTGKSVIAKATGTVADAVTVAFDLGAMKGSLVGQSEERIRAAMDVFKAVSQGKGLFIATCNKIASLPPELRRRFTMGTFFVDLPDELERRSIWQLWLKRYSDVNVSGGMPECDGWTGAEIRACCDVAYRTGMSLLEASKFVVPVIKSAPDQVEALRKMAHGRFISATNPGIYTSNVPNMVNGGRKMEV